ncbi:dienelactone hydrolase [Gluconacetobacter liquefaciens]|uniref:Prolyl oligopeptidase family serine peptidase n=1 Tax=Gluconacetobacter liquefaciens TaxID=89584 RepID=A0A370G1H5_GLULI|nr:prolyl oligopeptidase family serine peptidase [Gluconacetobacter liquefaciens]MBB2186943.1 prolyl oligopeptidase family serine peptidase [Gluconacetobacter liquefaciens]RDI37638.1 putative dienelactone hydrolase [Gluconacetobacter liquefaciens]GEB37169.1 dienelactone hydrolase [Gluconacetobacter liquefaciens]
MFNRLLIGALFTLLCPLLAPARASPPATVGFQYARMPDGTEIGIWYPTCGTTQHQALGLYEQDCVVGTEPVGSAHPLVVLSHGNGGSFTGHLDTAQALARAGFIVATLTHPGDNWQDQSAATRIERRPVALSALITYMLQAWPSRNRIDAARVGAFGFSAGGFTVLAAAGARPDLAQFAPHCREHPGFYDCVLLRAHPRENGGHGWVGRRDGRIKAIVVAAPALGFAFDRTGLAPVTIPVQLWKAGRDAILPAPYYADVVRDNLPQVPDFHLVPDAGHFDFLAPCIATAMSNPICTSRAGFDRSAFHARFNAAVVRFFQSHLR